MNGDAPRNFAPPLTSFRIASTPWGSAERTPVRSSTHSPSINWHALMSSCTPESSRRPETLTMGFDLSDVVSIRTVMRVCCCKHEADARGEVGKSP